MFLSSHNNRAMETSIMDNFCATNSSHPNENVKVKLQWTKILPKPDPNHPAGQPCARSSHGVSWIDAAARLIIYGGEHVARTPLEHSDTTWACDFDKSSDAQEGKWQWRAITSSEASGAAPPSRIAHAQAVHEASSSIYIFGGRAGITMQEQAMNDMWKLDCSGKPGTEIWSQVIPNVGDGDEDGDDNGKNNIPEARSFHKMLCIGDSLFVFGGCGETSGRLNDMHRFDIPTRTWHNLGQSQHLRGRGGPTFLPLSSGQSLGVVAGFAGEETNDGHVFDVTDGKWKEASLTEHLTDMRPRSVCVGASFPSAGVAVIFGGEVDPSAKGHEGAGGFENDVVLLEETTGKYIKTIPHDPKLPFPETRGWSDGGVALDNYSGGSLFVFGGLSGDDADPRRLDDLWKLVVSKE